jgi:hypothetical protein
MYSRGLFVLFFAFLGFVNAKAQEYPVWFFHQGTVNCRTLAVGYAEHSPQNDSTISYAFRNAAVNFAAFKCVTVKGGQTFWGTEAGKYRIHSSTQEVIDEVEVKKAQDLLRIIDFAEINGCMIVLAMDSNYSIPDFYKERVNLLRFNSPHWTEEIPKMPGFIFAVGLAPKYYYQSSSWIEAEWMARRNLARSLHSELKAVQKSSGEGESLEQLSSDVLLQNVEVVERWLDIREQLYYVLIRGKVN